MIARRCNRGFRATLLVASLVVCSIAHGQEQPLKPGDVPPDLVGQTIDGDRVLVSSYVGKVVVVSFWASWCGPCKRELPLLEGIQSRAGKDQVQVIAVNIEALETYRRIARKATSLQMLLAHESGDAASKTFGVHGIPHMVIIGRDGKIVRVHRGYTEEGVDQVIADLNRALAT